jgi:hypothetical protein
MKLLIALLLLLSVSCTATRQSGCAATKSMIGYK